MGGACFACYQDGSDQYTLVLESGQIIEDKWVCEQCLADFRDEPWIEVHDASVLLRGGGTDEETDSA